MIQEFVPRLLLAAFLTLPFGMNVWARNKPQPAGKFPLWNFDEINGTCRAKGRLQEKEYCQSRMMDEIVAQGKDAVPILISQLTETRPMPKPIYDYWEHMTTGDVAYFILKNLFTESNWTTFNMPGLGYMDGSHCDGPAEKCWQALLAKHGRKYIQTEWRTAWEVNKERIYWDSQARCYRLSERNSRN